MGFGKWIAGTIGWALGGPIGGLIGFGLGSMFAKASDAEVEQQRKRQQDQYQKAERNQQRPRTGGGDFGISLAVLSAAVMKADGVVKKSELAYVQKFLVNQFGDFKAKDLSLALRDILKKDIPLRQVCLQIKQFMPHSYRLQLMHYLFGISKADGHVDTTEVKVIQTIATYLNINSKDFASIKAMFYEDTDKAYKVLEIEPDVTNDQVKKAYRKMAIKYHPDKVSSLGEEFQKAAKEKFQAVQAAYDAIKKERGIN